MPEPSGESIKTTKNGPASFEPKNALHLKEAEVVKIILDFLSSRGFHISMRALERESGLVNGLFSDDVLFLRHLILDGQWDDVLQFIQPLETVSVDRFNFCRFLLLREKYLEMLCMKSEKDILGVNNGANSFLEEFNIDEVVACLHSMEKICPSREEYNSLCLLLTVQRLSDHPEFKNWNPSSARLECFENLRPVIEKILPPDSNLAQEDFTASTDRLMQVVVHGLLYESCLDFCQGKALSCSGTGFEKEPENEQIKAMDALASVNVLRSGLSPEGDPSLLSWLDECIPSQMFSTPFEQRDLTVNVGKIVKPPSASWYEQILLTPTPAQLTPGFNKSLPSPIARFSSARPKVADKMSMSMDVTNLQPFAFAQQSISNNSSGNSFASQKYMQKDVSKSYAHFSYRPMHSTIQEDTEEPSAGLGSRSTNQKAAPVMSSRKNSVSSQGGDSIDPFSSKYGDEYSRTYQGGGVGMGNDGEPSGNTSFQVRASSSLKQDQQTRDAQSRTPRKGSSGNLSSREARGSRSSLYGIDDRSVDSGTSGRPRNSSIGYEPSLDDNKNTPVKGSSMSSSAKSILFNGCPKPSPKIAVVGPEVSATASTKAVPSLQQSSAEPQRSNSVLQASQTADSRRSQSRLSTPSKEKSGDFQDMAFSKTVVLNDVQAVRSVAFHPNGVCYAVGANSKVLRVFPSPGSTSTIDPVTKEVDSYQGGKPSNKVLWAKRDVHKGSIYCIDWSLSGDLIATGSNDKMIKIIPLDPVTQQLKVGSEIELAMHDGTVRDVVFSAPSNGAIMGSPLLVSGGAGDCNIYVTDCHQAKALHAFAGHSGPILSLFPYGTHNLCSGSQDKTVRLWDMRSGKCTHVVNSDIPSLSILASPVCSVSVNSPGTVLAFGTEDAAVVLLDIRRVQFPHLATLNCHSSDVRSVRFAPSNPNYLLTGSYDSSLAVTYCGGSSPSSCIVGRHEDKVIQCRWNPSDLSFVSTSADRTACYWSPLSNSSKA